jgi:hypothetical protein
LARIGGDATLRVGSETMTGTGQKRERRRAARVTGESVNVTVHNVGSACATIVRGQIVDVSDRGLAILTRDKIQDRTSVTLRVEPWDWSGNGCTRYCAQRGLKFLIGLELSPGTRRPTAVERPAGPPKNEEIGHSD